LIAPSAANKAESWSVTAARDSSGPVRAGDESAKQTWQPRSHFPVISMTTVQVWRAAGDLSTVKADAMWPRIGDAKKR
jgi:hypothetical protein